MFSGGPIENGNTMGLLGRVEINVDQLSRRGNTSENQSRHFSVRVQAVHRAWLVSLPSKLVQSVFFDRQRFSQNVSRFSQNVSPTEHRKSTALSVEVCVLEVISVDLMRLDVKSERVAAWYSARERDLFHVVVSAMWPCWRALHLFCDGQHLQNYKLDERAHGPCFGNDRSPWQDPRPIRTLNTKLPASPNPHRARWSSNIASMRRHQASKSYVASGSASPHQHEEAHAQKHTHIHGGSMDRQNLVSAD